MSSELVSGLGGAILGAILSGAFAWWLHKAEQLRSRKDELRATIRALVDLQEEFKMRVEATQDPGLRESIGSTTSMKRAIYIEAAEVLVRQISRYVTSSEYNILATEVMMDANFVQAEKYYLKAVSAARSTFLQVVAIRSLAAFYFRSGPHRDVVKARGQFAAAVSLLEKPSDEYSTFVLGHTYQGWGVGELGVGAKVESKEKFQQARACYESLPNEYPLKAQALASLDRCATATAGVVTETPGAVAETSESVSAVKISNATGTTAQPSPRAAAQGT